MRWGLTPSSHRFDRLRNLSRIGESTHLTLREDRCSVDLDFEDAILALDQSRVRAEFFFELGRQPGGAWLIVSNNAVFNAYIHVPPTRAADRIGISF